MDLPSMSNLDCMLYKSYLIASWPYNNKPIPQKKKHNGILNYPHPFKRRMKKVLTKNRSSPTGGSAYGIPRKLYTGNLEASGNIFNWMKKQKKNYEKLKWMEKWRRTDELTPTISPWFNSIWVFWAPTKLTEALKANQIRIIVLISLFTFFFHLNCRTWIIRPRINYPSSLKYLLLFFFCSFLYSQTSCYTRLFVPPLSGVIYDFSSTSWDGVISTVQWTHIFSMLQLYFLSKKNQALVLFAAVLTLTWLLLLFVAYIFFSFSSARFAFHIYFGYFSVHVLLQQLATNHEPSYQPILFIWFLFFVF